MFSFVAKIAARNLQCMKAPWRIALAENSNHFTQMKMITTGVSQKTNLLSRINVIQLYICVSVVLSKSLCRKEREKLDITLDSTVVMLARV